MDRIDSRRVTSSGEHRVPSGKAAPRRTVRIVKRWFPTGAAGLSLAAVAVTAVFAFAGWRWWRRDETPPVPPPTLADVELEWKCATGHTFDELGQTGPRLCPQCGEPAFPITTYFCEKHGAHEVMVQFEKDAQGRARVSRFKVQGGEWVDAGEGPRCPRCDDVMGRQVDPVATMPRPKRKGP